MGSRSLSNSFSYWNRALKVIPTGTQVFSKGPDTYVKGVYPIYLRGGKGSHVFDVDGNEYIDYICGLGSIILGYGYPAVVDAIKKQTEEATNLSLLHPLEVEVAELLVDTIPCAEMVRYSKTGSDICSLAVRVARAYTGRERVAYCGYHGCQEWFAASPKIQASRYKKGCLEILKGLVHPFEYNSIDSLKQLFERYPDQIAAVIMEPTTGVEEPKNNFLGDVKQITHQNGAVLIFDEIVTGFRFSLGGAQEFFDVIPDLACFGKAVANGMPLSILVGKAEVMKVLEEVFFSTTFGGEMLSLAAAKATINELRERPVIQHIWAQGRKLSDSFGKLARENNLQAEMVGYPPINKIRFLDSEGHESKEVLSLFLQEAVKRGILFGFSALTMYAHEEDDLERTIQACDESMKIVKTAIEEKRVINYLEGEVVKPVFERR
jgi:glutamate-1-semialdehyde 2,1-aminomutase/spore coat polysaccharide biosynthesis protein SpsF